MGRGAGSWRPPGKEGHCIAGKSRTTSFKKTSPAVEVFPQREKKRVEELEEHTQLLQNLMPYFQQITPVSVMANNLPELSFSFLCCTVMEVFFHS